MTKRLNRAIWSVAVTAACGFGAMPWLSAAELHVGTANTSITPDQPVPLAGQMSTRIAKTVTTPVTASVIALESRDGETSLDSAIMISCDLVYITDEVLQKIRQRIAHRLPDFDTAKLIVNATHTHTAPVTVAGKYELPDAGIMRPAAYVDFLAERVAAAAVEAWESRQPGAVGWGLGHAVVAQNRRAVYADGHAQMYGSTRSPGFRGIEGYEDHGVEVLFFWNHQRELIATAINVACPSQEVESASTVDADFWHPVRETLRARFGSGFTVLGWTGAAGDQSPHLMFRKQAEERMRKLRGQSRLEELSARILHAWEEAYAGAKQEIHDDVPLVHKIETIELPRRLVTEEELVATKAQIDALAGDPGKRRRIVWLQAVVDRYDRQQSDRVPPYRMQLHALRLGDIAIATNDFELFTEFGIQMKARSPALQTFVIQLAGPGTYVPTSRAAGGGGYSAIVASNEVGPDGGQVLTEETIRLVNTLWPTEH